MTASVDLLPAADRFVGWLKAAALPAWAERGFDHAAGRFHERLDLDGRPLAVPHRAMVQARQIYVYAQAGALGWFPGGIALADRAMETMRREFCERDGDRTSACFSIDIDPPRPRSIQRDAYTHAFILFAIAHLHRATGDPALLAFAEEIVAYVDDALIDPRHGGLVTDDGAHSADKLQNPQMHLLEAYLALAEAAPGGDYLARAGTLVALFERRMMRHDLGVLPERFAMDWGGHPDPLVADIYEPGHHFEWAWLLRWYERLAGADLGRHRAALMASATDRGAAGRLIYDQLGADGRIVRATHRLWPHCEAIKAAVACREAPLDAALLPLAEASAEALLAHFLGRPFDGGWIDQIDGSGKPIVDYVPASSLYHIMLAATVLDEAATPALDDAMGDR